MNTAKDTILKVDNLKLQFSSNGQTLNALNGISFSIRRGETFGFVGESGCGKSTTSRAILRLLADNAKITDGTIYYNETDLLKLSEKDLRKIRGKEIGMIFQDPMTALNPVLTIRKQIFEQLRDTKLSSKEKEIVAIEIMNKVGIPLPEKRLNEYIFQYSGGMRQRAMIAITLAGNPKLLIADEPTTALDVTIQDQIIKLLNHVKEDFGVSILLITHDLGVVGRMCDRVAVMYAGYIVEMADTYTLFSAPRHPYTKGLMDALPKLPQEQTRNEEMKPIPGALPSLSDLPQGCPFVSRCQLHQTLCQDQLPTMQEISPGHFARCHYFHKLEGCTGLINCTKG
ncbi:MAG: transporter ATP-binding protein [Firmicutes bacterium]|nr:transporter ATP-binding protein [Bacillota bacterium]